MRRTPENKESMRRIWRKAMLDSFEERNRATLSPDSLITVGEREGTAEELAEVLEPLAYEGTYVNPETGEREAAFLGVYEDKTGRAFAHDLRKDDEYRMKVSLEKPAELQTLELELDDAMADGKSEDETLAYGASAAIVAEVRKTTDWTDPKAGAEALDTFYDLIEDFEKRG